MEQQSIKIVSPDELGYEDRGIVKWLGMMLSDHSEALKREKKQEQRVEVGAKQLMSEKEIGQLMYQAYVDNDPISIQANIIYNGQYFQDLECKIVGYVDNQIYLYLKDGRSTSCTLEQIRHAETLDPLVWHNKIKK